jgi:hypothetical protein
MLTVSLRHFSESCRSVAVTVSVAVVAAQVRLVGGLADDLIGNESRGSFGSAGLW